MVERQLGDVLGLSIGTAIPIEKLLTSNTAKEYNTLYINVRTMYRNFIGSFQADAVPDGAKCYKEFLEELDTLSGIVDMSFPSSIRLVYYYPSYNSLESSFTKCKLKSTKTQLQKNYSGKESFIFVNILNKITPQVEVYDTKLNGNHAKALIITHTPLDLLSHHSFSKLTLLESHTANLKNKPEWITKLTKNQNYYNIPFNILTLQILGDRSTQFSAMSNKLIKSYTALATMNRWSPSTTLEKIKFDIRKMPDKLTAGLLLEMANMRLK